MPDQLRAHGKYLVTHTSGDRTERFVTDNLVTDLGLSVLLEGLTGASPRNWRVGLKSQGGARGTDTLSTHPNWRVLTNVQAAQAITFTPAGVGAITSTAARFTATDEDTAGGCFVTDGTLLLSVASFSPRPLLHGDTLTVQYTLTVSR